MIIRFLFPISGAVGIRFYEVNKVSSRQSVHGSISSIDR